MRETFVVNDILKKAISYRIQTIPEIACQLLSKKKIFCVAQNNRMQTITNRCLRANKKKTKTCFLFLHFVVLFCFDKNNNKTTALDNMS